MRRRARLPGAHTLTLLLALALALAACDDAAKSDAPDSGAVGTAVTPTSPAAATVFSPSKPPPPAQTPPPTPSPTPNANALQGSALHAWHNGDDAQATVLYNHALAQLDPLSADGMRVRFALARLQAKTDATAAINTFQMLAADAASNGNPELGALAHTWVGRLLLQTNPPSPAKALAATQALSQALALSPNSALAPYWWVWMGDGLMQMQQPQRAVAAYQQTLAPGWAPNTATEFARREKLALAYRNSQNFAGALQQHESILAQAKIPAYIASIKWEVSQDLLATGNAQRAHALWQDLIKNHAQTPAAALALQALLNASQPVDELQRGIVNLHAKNFSAAREAFRRAIQIDDGRADDVRLWAARNYLQLNDVQGAFRNLDQIIAANPSRSTKATEAHAEKVKYFADAEDLVSAQIEFALLLQATANSAKDATVLFSVGNALLRRPALFGLAVQAFYAVAAAQFDEKLGADALLRAAMLHYRLGQHTNTISATQLLQSKYPRSEWQPQALLWQGKAYLAAGNVVSGQAALQTAVQTSPDSYAGIRANALLVNAPPLLAGARFNVSASIDEQVAAEQWLQSWLSPTRVLTDTPALRDVRFARGTQLAQMGLEAEALSEFMGLLNDFAHDPVAMYRLAVHLRDLRLYRLSIACAEALMRLSPFPTPAALPKFVARLIYPAYYADLVLVHAQEFGIDPALVFAVIRQESLFEALAESTAAAQGLMQVIPSTGAEIHRELGWPPNYTTRDLTRPFVSVRFGAYYLSKQRRAFDGDWYAALAAYNGGAGNALRWLERSGDAINPRDPDVFYGLISFEETQRYVRLVTTNYAMYRRLYGN
jgi:soluble lytic murein transglycosylase